MKTIKIDSCKDCPYRCLSYSFANALWTLSCQKGIQKVSEHKLISESKHKKDKIKYDIPNWCNLEELNDS